MAYFISLASSPAARSLTPLLLLITFTAPIHAKIFRINTSTDDNVARTRAFTIWNSGHEPVQGYGGERTDAFLATTEFLDHGFEFSSPSGTWHQWNSPVSNFATNFAHAEQTIGPYSATISHYSNTSLHQINEIGESTHGTFYTRSKTTIAQSSNPVIRHPVAPALGISIDHEWSTYATNALDGAYTDYSVNVTVRDAFGFGPPVVVSQVVYGWSSTAGETFFENDPLNMFQDDVFSGLPGFAEIEIKVQTSANVRAQTDDSHAGAYNSIDVNVFEFLPIHPPVLFAVPEPDSSMLIFASLLFFRRIRLSAKTS